MFVVLVYDVNKKRVSKVMKTCRKYLVRVQNSVFEGNITEARLNKLKTELKKTIVPSEDSINIYSVETSKIIYKEGIGMIIDNSNII